MRVLCMCVCMCVCAAATALSRDAPPWLQFGYSAQFSFPCDLRTLVDSSSGPSALNTTLFDLYIVDGAGVVRHERTHGALPMH
jgi:hypothetical protein